MPDGEGRVGLAPGLAVIGRAPDSVTRSGQNDVPGCDDTGQRFLGQGVPGNGPIAICLRDDEQACRRRQKEVACHCVTKILNRNLKLETGNSEPVVA